MIPSSPVTGADFFGDLLRKTCGAEFTQQFSIDKKGWCSTYAEFGDVTRIPLQARDN